MKAFDYIGIGFCSNDHLAVLPFIPMDTKVKMVSHAIMGGGPAANSTAGAATLGVSAAFVGTVGDDADGRMILEAVAKAKILHLDGHNAAGAIAAAKVARDAGVTVMYDAGTHRDGMEELLPLADLLICSEEFILKLTGLKDAEEAVRQVYAKYRPKVCGATMGVRGSMCFDGKEFVKCPAFHVEKVVDTTGCGDLFHTGFAVRWLESHDLLDCQRFGAAVSAIKCRGLSGRPPSAPTRAEVEDFLSRRLST